MNEFLENAKKYVNDVVEEISVSSNQYLYPYLLLFQSAITSAKIDTGIFFMDSMGIYVPLKSDDYSVFYLERLPFEKKSIYALSDFQNCAYYEFDAGKIHLYFKGVEKVTESIGYRFKESSFEIIPLLDVDFSMTTHLCRQK